MRAADKMKKREEENNEDGNDNGDEEGKIMKGKIMKGKRKGIRDTSFPKINHKTEILRDDVKKTDS